MEILFTFLTEKKPCFEPIRSLFDYLIFINIHHHPNIMYEDIVQKDMNKFQIEYDFLPKITLRKRKDGNIIFSF